MLHEQIKNIKSKEDFVLFVKELRKDFIENPQGWENKDIAAFLDALAVWTTDMENYYSNTKQSVPKNIDWKVIADMLMGAKMYE